MALDFVGFDSFDALIKSCRLRLSNAILRIATLHPSGCSPHQSVAHLCVAKNEFAGRVHVWQFILSCVICKRYSFQPDASERRSQESRGSWNASFQYIDIFRPPGESKRQQGTTGGQARVCHPVRVVYVLPVAQSVSVNSDAFSSHSPVKVDTARCDSRSSHGPGVPQPVRVDLLAPSTPDPQPHSFFSAPNFLHPPLAVLHSPLTWRATFPQSSSERSCRRHY